MSGLELKFLGDFEVRRGGRPLPLPPSKKTRALLAWLGLNERRFRREQLCELLWEIPDDPRGSLRWSLSKLRRLVDEPGRPRVLADRDSVGIDATDLSIDVGELRRLAAGDLARVEDADLAAAVARYRGNFLEGLEFSTFHDFHAWCVAEREQALRDQAALLGELVRRLGDTPARALPHARTLVGLSPYDESARATLIRLLHAARQPNEADEQFRLGLRMLQEAGIPPTGILQAARRGPGIEARPVPPAGRGNETAPREPVARILRGRDAECERIAERLSQCVRDGRAAVLVLRGAPGIGKSRVLEYALGAAGRHNAGILHASAFETDAIRPFALWIDALRARDGADVERVFGAGDAANRDRLFAGLSELIAGETVERPVVFAFDDVQWCDESSAAALHYVTRMNRERALFGLIAARDGELRDNVPLQQALRGLRRDGLLDELELGPLPAKILEELIDEQAPVADSGRLSRECGGNPLLAIELARAERTGTAVGTLDDLIRERLGRCGVTGSEVLHWASVLNPHIDIGTLSRVSGLESQEVGTALEDAERQSLLVAGDRGMHFSHDLIARAVYNDISPIRRQVMHRRIAELLELDTAQDLARAAALAHHAAQSQDPGLTARAMVSAGRLSLRFFANDDAASLARKGLQISNRLPADERARVEVDLNEILLTAGAVEDWEAAAEAYAQLAERALDHGALAHARLGYHMAAWVRWAQGRWSDAREQTLQAARVVRGGDDEAHIVGIAETAKCLVMIERDLSQAAALLMESAALAERRHISHHAICAGRGMLCLRENRLDEAEELFREARTLAKSAGDRLNEFQANEYLAAIDLQRGRVHEAKERCSDLLALGEKLRGGSEEPFARALLGLCTYALDDDAAPLAAALDDLRIADAKHRLAYVLTRAALVDCERGRQEPAIERAAEALGYAQLLERATEALLASAVLAHCHRATGSESLATKFIQESQRLEPDAAVWAREILAGLLHTGRRDVAAVARSS
jgi:DNA-binding SARP family transcriptional activator